MKNERPRIYPCETASFILPWVEGALLPLLGSKPGRGRRIFPKT